MNWVVSASYCGSISKKKPEPDEELPGEQKECIVCSDRTKPQGKRHSICNLGLHAHNVLSNILV